MSKSETASKLFAQPCDFMLAAGMPEQFPSTDNSLPEVAFIGRSNVGKSSLINALTGRKGLAHASNTPGRTQQIVFFNLNQRLILVDLPGYGYASAPTDEARKWNSLTRHYLKKRSPLRMVCLLIDSRRGAMDHDLSMMEFLDSVAVNYQIILTKSDQLSKSEQSEREDTTNALLKKHPAARPCAMLASSSKSYGISDIQALLAGIALP